MNVLQTKISEFAAKVVKNAQESGLTWDEAVGSLGLAANMLAHGELALTAKMDSIEHARKRLEEGFAHNGAVYVAASDISGLANASPVEVETVLANSDVKLFMTLN